MATHHTREKQKKGGVMYVYKLDTGNLKPKEPADSSAVIAKKGFINSNIIWGLRRSKTVREVVDHGRFQKTMEDEKEIVESRKSHLEVKVASVTAFLQVKVLVTDMPRFMQLHAFRCARGTYDSLEKFSSKAHGL